MFIVTHNAGNRANRCKSDELQVFGLRCPAFREWISGSGFFDTAPTGLFLFFELMPEFL